MSDFQRLLDDVRFRYEECRRPWHAFIGGITLTRSEYVEKGAMFAVDTSRAPIIHDIGQSVVVHPDDVEPMRKFIREWTGQPVGDLELAAAMYWMAHNYKKKKEKP